MTEQEQFFYDHAGYSYKPGESAEQGRRRCAVELAAAERWADANDYTFHFVDEDDLGSATDEQQTRIETGETIYLQAWLTSAANVVVASLGGIEVESDRDPYLRVVKAELA